MRKSNQVAFVARRISQRAALAPLRRGQLDVHDVDPAIGPQVETTVPPWCARRLAPAGGDSDQVIDVDRTIAVEVGTGDIVLYRPVRQLGDAGRSRLGAVKQPGQPAGIGGDYQIGIAALSTSTALNRRNRGLRIIAPWSHGRLCVTLFLSRCDTLRWPGTGRTAEELVSTYGSTADTPVAPAPPSPSVWDWACLWASVLVYSLGWAYASPWVYSSVWPRVYSWALASLSA